MPKIIKHSLIIRFYQGLNLCPECLELCCHKTQSDHTEHMPVAQKNLALWIHHLQYNWPRVSQSSDDCHTLVCVGTGPSSTHSFVLLLSRSCMISIGAVSCSLIRSSHSCYCCPVSCSLYCIGMTCGGPCSSPD